nr:alpha/beta hydrolase [Streptomyces sp. DHE17-7]
MVLTWEGEGHGAYGSGSDCVDSAVDAYLLNGRSRGRSGLAHESAGGHAARCVEPPPLGQPVRVPADRGAVSRRASPVRSG